MAEIEPLTVLLRLAEELESAAAPARLSVVLNFPYKTAAGRTLIPVPVGDVIVQSSMPSQSNSRFKTRSSSS
jgi:hypothetical protein